MELTARVGELVTGEQWATAIETAAKFHRYSFGNGILIARQRPDATLVAGFNRWKELGRCVRKGEKGIAILAPMVGRKCSDEPRHPTPPSCAASVSRTCST